MKTTNGTLYSLLFEAPIDAWLAKNRDVDRTIAEPVVNRFLTLKDSIFLPDPLKYTLESMQLVIAVIDLSKKSGLKANEIKWITKQMLENPKLTLENIKEDFIPILKTYSKNKQGFEDLWKYKNIAQLARAMEEKSDEIEGSATDQEKDIFYREGGWLLAMPHTTAASCELGSGTTWCTARTKSQNLFLSYVGRGENIILFYVIREGGNPRTNPTDKISVGFINGEPAWDQGHGGITVDANNDSVTEEEFSNLLGPEVASRFIEKMREKVGGLGGSHPAKKEIEKLAVNEKLLQKKLLTFKGNDELIDFVHLVLSQTNVSNGVFLLLSENPDEEVRKAVAINKKIPVEIAMKLTSDPSAAVRFGLTESGILNKNKELQERIHQLNNKIQNDIHKISYEYHENGKVDFKAILSTNYEEYENYIALNVNTIKLPEWVEDRLVGSNSELVRIHMAERMDLSEKAKLALANDIKQDVRTTLLKENRLLSAPVLKQLILNEVETPTWFFHQENFTPELMDLLAEHTTDPETIRKIINSRKALPQTLAKLAKANKNYYSELLNSDNISAETIQLIYDNTPDLSNHEIQALAGKERTPPAILAALYNKLKETTVDSYSIHLIAGNSNTPPEVLEDIYNTAKADPNRMRIFGFLAQNANAPVNILTDLSNKPEYYALLSKNPSLPANLAEKIFNTNGVSENIQNNIVSHSSLPENFLTNVALDPSKSITVRGDALKNKNVSYAALKPFIDAGGDMKVAALGNPNLPEELLRQYAQSSKRSEALEVASNPSLPKDLMMTLAQGDGLVQLALLHNPNIDKEVVGYIAKNGKLNMAASEARRMLGMLSENKNIKLYSLLYG